MKAETMDKMKFDKEQPIWFYSYDHNGDLTQGVVDGFYTDTLGHEHIIIRVSTHVDDVFHMRDLSTVSDDPTKPIGIWRRFGKRRKNVAD